MRGQQLFLCMRKIRKAPLNEALREDDLHLDGSFSCKDDSEARDRCRHEGLEGWQDMLTARGHRNE